MQKTTILIIENSGKSTKSVTVPNTLIKNWKKYLVSGITTIVILMATIGYLVYYKVDNQYQNQIFNTKEQIASLQETVDVEKLKLAFQSIDANIGDIKKSLKARGIKTIPAPSKDKIAKMTEKDVNYMVNYYKKYISNIEELVAVAPIGRPSNGKKTSGFGRRPNPFTGRGGENHKGQDFRGPMGEPIKSTAAGKVLIAHYKGGYGKCVVIDHGNSYKTLYGHLSKITVKEGQNVKEGQQIGNLGSTGRSTGPHLHYEVMKDDVRIDPEDFLRL